MPRFHEFRPKVQTFDDYLECFQIFVKVNAVKRENEASTFSNFLGTYACGTLLKTRCFPRFQFSGACQTDMCAQKPLFAIQVHQCRENNIPPEIQKKKKKSSSFFLFFFFIAFKF